MRVLFVEEDIGYLNAFIDELSRDFVVDIAHSAEDGEYLSEINDYDVIVVDENLHNGTGMALANNTRDLNDKSSIVLLSDKYNLDLKIIESLEHGIDLCFPRNTNPQKLKQGISALIRKNNTANKKVFKTGGLEFDLNDKTVKVNGAEVQLRRKEYDILEYMILKRGRIVSKEEILEHMWVSGIYILSNTVEVHITNIRNSLEKPYGVKFIETIRGFGYRIRFEK